MKHITFYLDFVSPYAWLAFAQLPQALEGITCHLEYRPVLLGALLQRHNNPGPPGIPGKYAWTCRHVQWLGHSSGVPLHMPARHPFNPLPLLRLALQCSADGCINRFVADTVFRHVWQTEGADALDAARLHALRTALAGQLRNQDASAEETAEESAKRLLRQNTEAAAALDIFGVPGFVVEGAGPVFWGLDSLPMLRACLLGDAWFDGAAWNAPAGV